MGIVLSRQVRFRLSTRAAASASFSKNSKKSPTRNRTSVLGYCCLISRYCCIKGVSVTAQNLCPIQQSKQKPPFYTSVYIDSDGITRMVVAFVRLLLDAEQQRLGPNHLLNPEVTKVLCR